MEMASCGKMVSEFPTHNFDIESLEDRTGSEFYIAEEVVVALGVDCTSKKRVASTLKKIAERIEKTPKKKFNPLQPIRRRQLLSTKHNYPNLKPSEIIASILGEFEGAGHASRFIRKGGKIAWRATEKMLRKFIKGAGLDKCLCRYQCPATLISIL